MHQNIDSLFTKSEELIMHIEEFKRQNINIDVICITEHNMIMEDTDELHIPNYRLTFVVKIELVDPVFS